jgi:exopolysaccharide biosynthesis predicted pyruvyltransferase EpsI
LYRLQRINSFGREKTELAKGLGKLNISVEVAQPLISVIVPIHKVEPYLRKCVDSIINQTYQNLEIILVDDGSPDGCGAICDEYAEKDSRVRVIHKPNGGLSSARNAGIDIAAGEWLGFVDSDDYCMPEMYEKLYNAAKSADADMVICGYTYVDEQGLPVMNKGFGVINDLVLTGDDALHRLCERGNAVWVTAFNKLYKYRLLNAVRFPEGRIHEDEFTIHHFFDKCNRVVSISDSLYNYVQRDSSIMSRPFTIKRLDAYYALWDRYNFFLSKEESFTSCATKTLRICGGCLSHAILNLNWREHKDVLRPLYLKMLLLFIKKRDLRAGQLFVWRHKWMYHLLGWAWRTLKDIRNFAFYLSFLAKLPFVRKPRTFLLATPEHGNLGDHAIVYAEKAYFRKQGKISSLVEVRNDLWLRFTDIIATRIKPQDTIVIDGGGNLGTLWPNEDDKITDIISWFKDNEIIVFPQTCYYDNSPGAKARLERNKEVYAAANNLTVMLRDKASYDFFSANFAGVKAVLTQDIVFSVDDAPKLPASKRNGVLLCFRADLEKVMDFDLKQNIIRHLTANGIAFWETNTLIGKRVTPINRNRELRKKWREFSSARLVITDRLHGMIFAVITETPCIALDNKSGKVSGSYEFIKDLGYVRFCRETKDVISSIIKMMGNG